MQRRERAGLLTLTLFLAFLQPSFGQAAGDGQPSDAERLYRKFYTESVMQREQNNRAAQYMLLRQALAYRPDAAEALADLAGLAAVNPYCSEEQVEGLYGRAVRLWPENSQFR